MSKGQILYLCFDSCFSCVWGKGEMQAIFPPAFTANFVSPPLCISLSSLSPPLSDLVVGVCQRAATALVRTSNFSATTSSRASSFKQDSRLLKREGGRDKSLASLKLEICNLVWVQGKWEKQGKASHTAVKWNWYTKLLGSLVWGLLQALKDYDRVSWTLFA